MSEAAPTRPQVAVEVAVNAAERDVALFVGNGFLTREVAHLADGPGTFYLFGGMGLATSVACGYREATGRPAVVLEGDGNFAMGLGGALYAPAAGPAPLVHVVVFNGHYESSGGQTTLLRTPAQVASVATALGYRHAWVADTLPELRRRLRDALEMSEGASLVCAHTPRLSPPPPRPRLDAADCTQRFSLWRQEQR
ncbi:thiamine pyrophosphate-dependent enzyme [Streptomyces sp. NL15-2K]|uniref:thiamine pyrophosphate-dependent enzyme n=1 Tax=Streptomyces sp. NL15-2K TaxID=376149 RepID=UPI000FF9E08A|nr:thiamine pyrophosphate-dependent enzyme [Streptomyces sp. NL15-2K]GCB47962.1 phosphonopyruvate decarboxylase [Streptomyces sp. NL15-2K]